MPRSPTLRRAISMRVVDAVFFFFLGLLRDEGSDDSSAYHLVHLECVQLTHSCYRGLRFETKVSCTAGLFPLLSWGRTLCCGTQSDAFVWQQTDWPYNIYPPSNASVIFMNDTCEFKFLFSWGSRNGPTVLTFVSMESKDVLLAGGQESEPLCPGRLMSCWDQMAMWQVIKTGVPIAV